jgi:hypothetical protein
MEHADKKNTDEARQHEADVIDRRLGDEWSDWVGDLSSYEKEIEEGKELFLSFYLISLFALTVLSMFIYYMIAPRLYQINPALDMAVMYLITGVFGLLFLWSLLLFLSIYVNRNLMFFSKKRGLHIEWIYPLIYKVAGMFKISKDRIGHSVIKINNALVYATGKTIKSKNLLVLLPRCLDKDTRAAVTEISNKYGVTAFTATGGSSARQMVRKMRPDAIIGVACERDLLAGMSDTPGSIAVIGIPNKRPFGPCKDTRINTGTLEDAVKFLLKL